MKKQYLKLQSSISQGKKIAALLLLFVTAIMSGQIRYVKPGGSGSHNGSSWSSASGDLQLMINSVESGGQVWVAEGTYQLSSNQSFTMRAGIKIFGGFPNNNTAGMAQRNPAVYTTILKGSNTFVVYNSNNGLTATAVLDGFTITGGNRSGDGGGMYNFAASPTISNCIFTGNTASGAGGGMYNRQSSPIVLNCTFSKNTAASGGGMYNDSNGFGSVSPVVTNCVFGENQSVNGGAVYVTTSSTARYINCTFSKNRASNAGGALYNLSTAQVNNCIFWNNFSTANTGSELYSSGGTITAANCLINITATSVQGSLNHQNTISGDPLFSYPAGNVFSLTDSSPAKNSGSTALYTNAATSQDMAGNPRVYGSQIDLGPFEFGAPFSGSVRYVKKGGGGNGSSWQYAMGDLQEAINASSAGNEVWVAKGTYQTHTGQPFQMKEGVKMYGGFPSDDNTAAMAQRNPEAHPAVLKGNASYVIAATSLTPASLLDGFTITGNQTSSAGAMYNYNASPTIVNCVFSNNISGGNYGGGMLNNGGAPIISNCTFKDNSGGYGAGMYNYSSSPIISNCIFRGNTTSLGSAMYNHDSSPVITNCIFNNNQGPVYNFGTGTPKFINVTFAQNSGGVMENNGNNSPKLYNCILWDNPSWNIYSYNGSSVTAYNCLFTLRANFVAGPFSHENTISGNPLFTDPANYNFTLQGYSPAVNSGNSALFPGAGLATDIAGNPRVTGPKIDIGAHESSFLWPATGNVHYVKPGGTGNGSNWDFASGSVQDMINVSESGHEVWVAAGTYYPTLRAGTGNEDRDKSIVLKNGVNVYGGFAGTETARDQRDWTANTTVLSGDLGLTGDDADNAYHVVISVGAIGTASLDGFTITRGNANGSGQIAVTGSVLNRNDGGGLSIVASSPSIVNCVFTTNLTSNRGGATFNDGAASLPKYSNCLINGNSAANAGGAAYVLNGSSPTYTNCTIAGNYAFYNGGGIYTNLNAAATVYNSVIWNNDALLSTGNQVYSTGGGSVTASHSIIKNGSDDIIGTFNGTNMLYSDPLFASGSYTLQPGSPAINAGSTTLFAGAETAKDLAGNPRLLGSAIDMGAYEINTECTIVATWNGSGWINGVPVSNDYAAVINGDYNSADDGQITACSLTVNNGEVIVASGDVFTIKGALTVDPSASLKFENNAHLIQEGTTNTNSGNIEQHRNSSLLFRQDYTMWSSPVDGQGLRDFSEETLFNRFYSYNPVTNHLVGIFPNNEAADVDFATGQGYLIRMPNGAPQAGYVEGTTSIIYDGSFTGTPNNGNIMKEVTPTGGQVLGYNAIGNPYPSPISIPAFFAANNGNTDGTIYLWRRKNGSDTASAYCTINSVGEYVDNGQLETENPNGFIQTGQGFIVKALTNTVNFNNTMRSATTNHDGSFFRMNNTSAETGTETETETENQAYRIWLNLSKEGMHVAQMLVGYRTNATMGIDMGIDAPFINDVETGLNSIIDDKAYAIQGRSLPFDAQDIVPLQFKTETAGSYSIAIDHVDGLFLENQPIYIRDKQLNETHDIKASGYSFTSDAGVFNNRFEIVYATNALGTNEPKLGANTVIIYKQDRHLIINSGTAVMANVKVFDTRGRIVYERSNIKASETIISDLRAEEQMLIVQITTVENAKVSKKVIY